MTVRNDGGTHNPPPAPPVGPHSTGTDTLTQKLLRARQTNSWGYIRDTLRGLGYKLPNVKPAKDTGQGTYSYGPHYNAAGPLVKKALDYYINGQTGKQFDKWLKQRNQPAAGNIVPQGNAASNDDGLIGGGEAAAIGNIFPGLQGQNIDMAELMGMTAPQSMGWKQFYDAMTKGDKKWMKDPRLLATALTDLEFRKPITDARDDLAAEDKYRGNIAQNVESAFNPLLAQLGQDQQYQGGLAQSLAGVRSGQAQGLASAIGGLAGQNFATQAQANAGADDAAALAQNQQLGGLRAGALRERGLITSGRQSDSQERSNQLKSDLSTLIKNRGATWGQNLVGSMNNRAGMFEKAMGLSQAQQGMDLSGALAGDQLRQGRLSTMQQLQNLQQSGAQFNTSQALAGLQYASGIEGIAGSRLERQIAKAKMNPGLLNDPSERMSLVEGVLGMVLPQVTGIDGRSISKSPAELLPQIQQIVKSSGLPWKKVKNLVMARLKNYHYDPNTAMEEQDPNIAFAEWLKSQGIDIGGLAG